MTRVKLCGLRRPQDAHFANRCMPDYAGFIFAPGKRCISHTQAACLRGLLDKSIQTVGVFVNAPIDEIEVLAQKGVIDLIQLHGDEDACYIDNVKRKTGKAVIRMAAVGSSLPPLSQNADYILYDTLSAKRGGAGVAFDWRLLLSAGDTPYFLAGGLNPGNVGKAIELLQPFAVDVSSGIETDGIKDGEKMWLFTQSARKADASCAKESDTDGS